MSDSKSKKIKKTKSNQIENQISNTNRGKPSDIQRTILAVPNIWTNDQVCLRLIKYLQESGRHICLHQAGKQTEKNNYQSKQNEIEKTRAFYEKSEKIAEDLFGHKCETKRCLVFFFRTNQEEKISNYNWIESQFPPNYQDCVLVLNKVQALFNQKFLSNLIQILTWNKYLEILIDSFLENAKTPQQFSQIIQNIYIKYILDQMKQKNSYESYNFKNREEAEKNFYSFLESDLVKSELEKFIKEIKQIFNKENDQYDANIIQLEDQNQVQVIDNSFDSQSFNFQEEQQYSYDESIYVKNKDT
ncbi:unnamed protein product [Paramecium sonneborni]|uniref:Uncharacterized protein n=1 Tax=Paramecium sonneborni TaxID=65129 RepID=A0A8S1N2I0_9CILI|nr:unnamed protein product [Paramecium sonneborni]